MKSHIVSCAANRAAHLRAAAALHSRFGQVNQALQRIHAEYARDLSVEELAETAGMSPSAFHQNFKSVTSTSPLQYLKTIRLHKARMLMAYEGLRAGIAAERVGYESSSQFSREFKRLFGTSPVEETERVRQMFGVPGRRRWRCWNRTGLLHALGYHGAAWKLSARLHRELDLIAGDLSLRGRT